MFVSAADGLHFENLENATVFGYKSRNTGDGGLAASSIPTSPNCG
jgi:hypothetical protein